MLCDYGHGHCVPTFGIMSWNYLHESYRRLWGHFELKLLCVFAVIADLAAEIERARGRGFKGNRGRWPQRDRAAFGEITCGERSLVREPPHVVRADPFEHDLCGTFDAHALFGQRHSSCPIHVNAVKINISTSRMSWDIYIYASIKSRIATGPQKTTSCEKEVTVYKLRLTKAQVS